MAETVVSFVLDNLARLLAHEAKLIYDVRNKVESLESELKIIKAFLESCQLNQRKSQIEQEIESQIKGIAHEAEDAIDTFVVHAAKYQRRNRLSRILHVASYTKLKLHVAKKIDNINARLKSLHVNRTRYNTQEAAGSSTDQEHKRRRDVEEDDVVGFEHDTTEVINRLKQGGSSRDVVSIIGMGGLGKTTLARKIYNSDDVKNYFQCRAWVSVSNDYRPKELLHALLKYLKSISDDFSRLSEEELKDKVKESLKGKRYFIVLDDMWNPQHWVDLQNAFPDENKSSRILITSRLREVASRASPSPPYYLPLLNEEQSWELFSKKMFRGEGVPSDLKLPGEHMVKSCRGLPISIVVLAEILANKEKSYQEWSKIMYHVNSYLTRPKTRVHDIVLKLSFDSLRPRLKLCFLYFGMFPEDYKIPVRRLIHLWVAEGFIDLDNDSRTAEDIAKGYLDELINHSLIHVGRRRSDGGIKTCHIHVLLREFCIYESKKEAFEVCRDANIISEQTKPHRLSIQCKMSSFFNSNNQDLSATRSMLCFDHESCYNLNSSMSKRLVGRIQLVRVLDLILPISTKHKIPTNLNMLVHLKYLRLDLESYFVGGFHKVIPEIICNLWNLETFDLRCSYSLIYIPFSSGIWKLKRLRHLYTAQPMILPKLSSNVESKTTWNLETLSCVAIKKKSVIVSLIEKGVFQKLRTLGLRCYKKKDGKHKQRAGQVWEILPKLNDLNALKIDGFPDIPTSVNAFPSNLAELTISEIKLNDDVMSTLGSLTNLRILKLHRCDFTERLRPVLRLCSINGFPLLEAFQLKRMSTLYHWELGKNVMPYLRRLTINYCEMLTALPNELWSLTSLREVQVAPSSESVKRQLQRQPMRDGCNLIIS